MQEVKLGKKHYFLKILKDESKKVIVVTVYEKYKATLDYFFDLTTYVNGIEHELKENEILVKTWSGISKYFEDLLATGIFKDTNKKIAISQHCEASIWEIDTNILKELKCIKY